MTKPTCKKSGCKIKVSNENNYCGLHTIRPKTKKNKFNAVRQTYRGKSYDSKLEAKYAYQLDMLKLSGEVKEWIPQKTLKMIVAGKEICRYAVDFFVKFTDGRQEYWEVKSKATMTYAWRIKWKLAKALYPDFNFVIKY